jgi:hypothetical protein
MEIIIGVDPGINGAAAAYMRGDNEGPALIVDAIDLPTESDGTKRQIAVIELSKWARRMRATKAAIERVTPMASIDDMENRRGMGATSAFRFGGAVYAIRTTFRLSGIPVIPVTPVVWKRDCDLIRSSKEDSRQLALVLFPEAAHLMKRKKDHQRAEAMLIARWLDRYLRRRAA